MTTLEKEFEKAKIKHQKDTIKTRIIQYYTDLIAVKSDITDDILQLIEHTANCDLERFIKAVSRAEFNEVYNNAYNELFKD